MSNLRLGLDLDGCLVNFNDGYRSLLAKLAGVPNTVPALEDPPCWDYETTYGYTEAHIEQAWRAIRADGEFWALLDPYPGVRGFLDWLWREVAHANWTQGSSHEVYFITARPGHRAKDQAELWLKHHGFAGKVPTVLMAQDKGRIAADLKLTHVLDDKPDHIEDVRAYHGRCTAVLLDRAYNRDAQARLTAKGAVVVPDLAAFQSLLAAEL